MASSARVSTGVERIYQKVSAAVLAFCEHWDKEDDRMATRPAWTVQNGRVISRDFEFAWNGGFAESQKKKNVRALHEAIEHEHGEHALEASTKSDEEIGKKLSAFNLRYDGVLLENLFQSSKRYEKGGPYRDLLSVSPKDAKRDERHRTSGRLLSFEQDGFSWPLEPKTVFYDYIYVSAVVRNFGKDLDLSAWNWFTDIEFNPKKSINCQARALAIYKLLQQLSQFEILEDRDAWIRFHGERVSG